ncbi:MAG: zinc metalloprotease HtpX [Gemmatimonas sp.]|jgi:heat shock protein HtpX|uniref:zinc metalloprotease HtpX n=1 Tax=Gemmatimonas sp. TaxID=1962908 RepID=UPI00391F4324|nr:zinc metalloprotease HtpX [Gemmatimonadota bacterium]
MNNIKVFVLMAGLTGLVVAIGQAVGGGSGAIMGLLMAAGMNLFMYWGSSSMVLRSYNAQVVTEREAPELYAMVDRLRQRAGLPMPTVAIAPHDQPNAFATGRNPEHSVVCVTEGLMRMLSTDELEGVVAHELAHIKNRDMLLQTIAATMAGAIGNIAQFALFFGGRGDDDEGANPAVAIALMIIGPIIGMVIQFAISRQREFKADAVGAEICGRPISLANALLRLESGARRIPMQVSPNAAPLAIVNPLAAFSMRGVSKWFSTHPPTDERVAALRALAG